MAPLKVHGGRQWLYLHLPLAAGDLCTSHRCVCVCVCMRTHTGGRSKWGVKRSQRELINRVCVSHVGVCAFRDRRSDDDECEEESNPVDKRAKITGEGAGGGSIDGIQMRPTLGMQLPDESAENEPHSWAEFRTSGVETCSTHGKHSQVFFSTTV